MGFKVEELKTLSWASTSTERWHLPFLSCPWACPASGHRSSHPSPLTVSLQKPQRWVPKHTLFFIYSQAKPARHRWVWLSRQHDWNIVNAATWSEVKLQCRPGPGSVKCRITKLIAVQINGSRAYFVNEA